jgi:hypothetical protein
MIISQSLAGNLNFGVITARIKWYTFSAGCDSSTLLLLGKGAFKSYSGMFPLSSS